MKKLLIFLLVLAAALTAFAAQAKAPTRRHTHKWHARHLARVQAQHRERTTQRFIAPRRY